jgi:5-methylcytosine-specific restriction endonuclease McrA
MPYTREKQDRINASHRKWRLSNPDKVLEQNRAWREAHPNYFVKYRILKPEVEDRRTRNPLERHRSQRTRDIRLRHIQGSHTPEEWLNLLKLCNGRCLDCFRKVRLTVDHALPVSKGGTEFILNLQPLCVRCNSRKGTRFRAYKSSLMLPPPR